MPRTDLHKIEAHLAAVWVDNCESLDTAEGGHERMILHEQCLTLRRFLDHPHLAEDSHE